MGKFYRCCYIQPTVLCSVLIAFLLSATAMVFADPSPKEIVRSGSMGINEKTDTSVMAGERQFLVTPATTIIDENENQILLNQLPIPCEAVIEYQLRMDEDPTCLRITVTRAL